MNDYTGSVQPPRSDLERLTVFQAAERIAAVRDRSSVVVLYDAAVPGESDQWDGLAALAGFCASHGIQLLAFSTDSEDEVAILLPELLQARQLSIPAWKIYRWRAGLLDSSFGRLGIVIGQTWTSPLVAVRDRTGRLVMQAEGVHDWSTVIAATRATVD